MDRTKTQTIGKDGIKAIMQTIADKLTYDETIDLLKKICDAAKDDITDSDTRLDRILWYVRLAYLSGYKNALETYDEALFDEEQESTDKETQKSGYVDAPARS
jgi:hypothetical protein